MPKLITDAFTVPLKHFIARSGKCIIISSDKEKNTNAVLQEIHSLIKHQDEIQANNLADEGINLEIYLPLCTKF